MAADDPHPDADRIARLTTELERERQRAAAARLGIRELEQTVSTLTGALADTRTDIARARASLAWRIGHAITRFGRRVTFRPMLTEGALVRAEQRLERLDSRALPAAGARRPIAPLRPAMPEAERAEGRRAL